MRCLLVFNQLNDILLTKCDPQFLKHVHKKAEDQGLLPQNVVTPSTNDLLIQLFAPIVTSQRLMTNQFGNSYSYIQCDNSINLVFREYMGFLFLYTAEDSVPVLNQGLSIFISLVKHICGPNVPLLKTERRWIVNSLFDAWVEVFPADQSFLVEAVEQLMVNSELCAMTLKALKDGLDKIIITDFPRVHALVLVENKLMSLYSSKGAQDLAADDILFLALFSRSRHSSQTDFQLLESPQRGPFEFFGDLVLLSGGRPHFVYVGIISEGIFLLTIVECGNDLLSSGFYDAFNAINALQSFQTQKDIENVRHAFEFVDLGMKRIFDGIKKMKQKKGLDTCGKNVHNRWDALKRRYNEFLKTLDQSLLVRIESATPTFIEALRELHKISCLNEQGAAQQKPLFESVFRQIQVQMKNFNEFLKVKAQRNFTLSSRTSLSINKYLEEFPGLVHFLYIDRKNHRLTAPTLDFDSEDTTQLTKKKIWLMVDFVKSQLLEGHLSLMWKDSVFSYSYFLWFEDTSGSPLKPKLSPSGVVKHWSIPGILADDFYKRLIEGCFPKVSSKKVQCFELYCVHLGLATPSCVLEHSRRIAATIWEVTGVPSNVTDFL